MFGLMRKPKVCTIDEKGHQDYYFHRMHYCGTCKAIGNAYNQSSRFLLNFDTVFLAELLTLLDQEDTTTWEQNLQNVNTCFSMPKEGMPFSLEYAAATNVILGELKIDDNIKDGKAWKWKIANRYFSSSFQKAQEQLQDWGVELSTIYEWIKVQEKREKETIIHDALHTHLDYYAQPTAEITALLFAAGGKQTHSNTNLYQLGYQFGQLMYILDAFEDYEKDVHQSQFNPLATFWQSQKTLNETQLESVRTIILKIQTQLCLSFDNLPIAIFQQEKYKAQLQSNLGLRIYKERIIIPTTWIEKWQYRWQHAKNIAAQWTCQDQTWWRQLNYYMIALAVFVSPNTEEFLPTESKGDVFAWGAFITAGLASVVVLRKSRKEKRKERREKRKKEKAWRRLLRTVRAIITGKKSCFGDCFSACCNSCCSSCCNNCSDKCCDNCCDMDENEFWGWLLLIGLVLLLLVLLIILILFLAGVI